MGTPPRDTIDLDVPRTGPAKQARTDLGLALLSLLVKPGVRLTRYDIAAWCGCTDAAIYRLEIEIMRKLRNRLQFGRYRALHQEMARK